MKGLRSKGIHMESSYDWIPGNYHFTKNVINEVVYYFSEKKQSSFLCWECIFFLN